MQKRFFLTYTAIGSAIFCFGLAYLGDVAGKNIDGILAYVHDFAVVIVIGVALLAIGAFVWWRVARRSPAKTSSPRP
jgi:membrane protein DedA with SNARE-associated domain